MEFLLQGKDSFMSGMTDVIRENWAQMKETEEKLKHLKEQEGLFGLKLVSFENRNRVYERAKRNIEKILEKASPLPPRTQYVVLCALQTYWSSNFVTNAFTDINKISTFVDEELEKLQDQ